MGHPKAMSTALPSSCGKLCTTSRLVHIKISTWNQKVCVTLGEAVQSLPINGFRRRRRHFSLNPSLVSRFPPEIIMQLRTPFQGEPLRPLLNDQLYEENINFLLKACWSENPDHRPPFGSIRRQLRDTCPDRSGLNLKCQQSRRHEVNPRRFKM